MGRRPSSWSMGGIGFHGRRGRTYSARFGKGEGLERTIKALDGEQSTAYVFEGRLVLL